MMIPVVTLFPSIKKGVTSLLAHAVVLSHIERTVFISSDSMVPVTNKVDRFDENALP